MHRWVFVSVMLVAGASIVFASGEGEATTDPDRVYRLRLGTVVSPPHAWLDMAEFFAEEVSDRTDGAVTVSVYPSGTLGNDATMIDEMRVGTLDFVIGGAQNAAQFVQEYQVFGLSYLFESQAQFETAIEYRGPIFNRYVELYEEKNLDLRLLALSGGGTRNFSNNVRPINAPEDLDGIVMRVPGSPIELRIWSALGALPTSLPWKEIYSAMQAGVVNAFESTISGFFGSALYEVAPYMSRTEHLYMLSHFTMSRMTYDRLPEAYRTIVQAVAAQAAVLGVAKGREYDEALLERMREEHGFEANSVNTAPFIRIVAPLHDELAAEVNGSDILAMIRALE